MLKDISWIQYWTFILVAVFIYYAAVLITCYREDARYLFNRTQNAASIATGPADETAAESQFAIASRLIGELQEILERNYIKEELMMAVGQRLKEYKMLRATAFEVSVNNLIVTETAKRSIHFSEEDLRVLWQ